jgi:hypothetical protein
MKKLKKIFRIVLFFLLIGGTAAAIYIYKEYNRKLPKIEYIKADYTMQAEKLINEFEKDEKISNQKYLDKILEVEGNVKNVEILDGGVIFVTLGDSTSSTSIRCNIDSIYNKTANNLINDSHVMVKGVCTGFNKDELLGSDVLMVRCFVENEKSVK